MQKTRRIAAAAAAKKNLFGCILCILGAVFCHAAAPAGRMNIPVMNGPVNDYAGLISAAGKSEIASFLNSVNDTTGIQIAVLTVQSLKGRDIESFSHQTAEAWKLGQKGKDNGVLLLVSLAEKAIRIETGYGIESTLTDMKCGLIIRQVIAPYFKNGSYEQGIREGVKNIAGITTGNMNIVSQTVHSPSAAQSDEDAGSAAGSVIFLLLFILLMFGGIGRRGGLMRSLFWADMFGRRGGFGGRSSGGSFGNGGFSGGGGRFGGGGASGSW
ncbi:MAG: TPM domain-containing protein [Bacteroides sp.]|nr:TPM domain-containing protein [Prevotella sp.]MCM1406959.1 TPM domain-containing protein [Treponema brennaborense]MCM1470110.1 TPM domain-containing protein [Bacteroides sp.]